MTLKNGEIFEEELTCRFEIDIRNLANFDSSTLKDLKIWTLMGCFWPKHVIIGLKKHRGVIFHDTGERCKIWTGIDLSDQN